MSDPLHPTRAAVELHDPELFPPPRGVRLLLINECGVLIQGPWYEGALAWGYKPRIPDSVKRKMAAGALKFYPRQTSDDLSDRTLQSGSPDPD